MADESPRSPQAPADNPTNTAANQRAIVGEHRVVRKKRFFIWTGAAIALVLILILGMRWWSYVSSHEETDDAYVTGHMHNVSPRVAGTVVRVLVDDNQYVHAGQLLVQLDPRDFQVALQQAQAQLALAQNQSTGAEVGIPEAAANAQSKEAQASGNVASAQSQIAAAQANVAEARAGVEAALAQIAQTQADVVRTHADYDRFTTLGAQHAVTGQQVEQAIAAYHVAQAQHNAAIDNLAAAKSKVTAAQLAVAQARSALVATKGEQAAARAAAIQIAGAKAQFGQSKAQIQQAQAQVNQAKLNLSYCNIYAPSDGFIGKKNVEVGQRLAPGQALFSVIESNPWVVANFKETQMERIRHGQPVDIHVDAFPHKTFLGWVQGTSPASGAEFALLPPENATGNFTKIVQRIPVKIWFDAKSIRGYENRIVPGMSAVIGVDVAAKPNPRVP